MDGVSGGEGRAGRCAYLPIAEQGLIGDMRSVALVGSNGAIDWYCCPSFDAPSVFAAILDADRGGSFELAASVPARTKQFYFPDTNVQEYSGIWVRHTSLTSHALNRPGKPGD